MGHLTIAPSLYPFYGWARTHLKHHQFTNHLENDTHWAPLSREGTRALRGWGKWIYRASRGRFFFLYSLPDPINYQLAVLKGYIWNFRGNRILWKVRFSAAFALGIGFLWIGCSFKTLQWEGVLFFFLIPLTVLHSWTSLITLLQHTNPENRFLPGTEWDALKARTNSTFNVHYFPLFDWLTHDIAVHYPHHVTQKIPHYNLRKANAVLKAHFPHLINEVTFSWAYLGGILRFCYPY